MNNNKLIAEFMTGYDFEHIEGGYPVGSFDNNWHYLMPVVEKIESLGYVFTIQGGKAEYGEMVSKVQCFIAEDKLSSTYQAVVEFIKEFN